MKYYAGIGARKTPKYVIKLMEKIGKKLAEDGWVLRSGGAEGADAAFERGVLSSSNPNNKEIYLPSHNFNCRVHKPKEGYYNYQLLPSMVVEGCNMFTSKYHPYSENLKPFPTHLMNRNFLQIFGKGLGIDSKSISKMVICWTEDGCEDPNKTSSKTGGTGQAIRLCKPYTKILNLKNEESLERVLKFLGE